MGLIFGISIALSIVNLSLGINIIDKKTKSRLNKFFFLLCLCLAVWSFSFGIRTLGISEESFILWFKVSSFTFSLFPSLLLHFFMIFTRQEEFLSKKIYYKLIYLPLIFILYNIVNKDIEFNNVIRTELGWYISPSLNTFWNWYFNIYFVFYLMVILIFIYNWKNKTKLKREKRQANFLIAFFITTLIISIISYILASREIIVFSITPILAAWWTIGLNYSLRMFGFRDINPQDLVDKISSSIDFMIVTDREGKVKKISHKLKEIITNSEEIIGRNFTELFIEIDFIKDLFNKLRENRMEKCKCELTLITKEKLQIPINALLSVLKDNYNDIIGFIFIGNDISDIKQFKKQILKLRMVEDELKKSEEKYRIFFDMSPDCIYVLNLKENCITEANQATLDKFKLDKEQLKEKNYVNMFTYNNHKKLKKAYAKLCKGEEVNGLEVCTTNSHGEIFELEIDSIPIMENGEVVKVLNLARDITTKKQTERLKKKIEEKTRVIKKIREYDKLKSEFLANMSHELRTPLNVILSTIQLAKLYLNKDIVVKDRDKLKLYLSTMKRNSHRLLRVINNLIEISRIDSGFFTINLKNINIVEVVEALTLSVAKYFDESDRIFIFDTDVEEKIVGCDLDKIERIILNLLSNAIKFTRRGDSIIVKIRDEGDYVLIYIKDTGIGIPKEKQKVIFERFRQVDDLFTRNTEGGGMGLAITKSLVEIHGGTIDVESEYEVGSNFIVKLPANKLSNEFVKIDINDLMDTYKEKVAIEFSDIF